ncbi:MAG: proton-conducting transporter membrane subunit [Pseudomonadota bacterium]
MGDTYTAAFQKVHELGFLWLIPLFPLIGAAVNGILGKKLQDRFGKRAVHTIAVGAMVLSSLVACYAFIAKLLPAPAGERTFRDLVFPMIQLGALQVDFALLLDQLSGTMTLIITLIGTLIHVYSIGYMAGEKSYWRFFSYLNLFVFSMLLLVLGDSFILMFFGWEGVGLCSYLLIGFWYTDRSKAAAGMKAFVVNRVGDFAFCCGMFLLFWGLGGAWEHDRFYQQEVTSVQVVRVDPSAHHAGTGHGDEIAHAAQPAAAAAAAAGHGTAGAGTTGEPTTVRIGPTVMFHELRQQLAITRSDGVRPLAERMTGSTVWGIPILFLVGLCFFIGAAGKSAQIPLYVWLPDAMAGPTPVSALIHAATMVTAGVYMVARLNFVFWLSPGAMTVVATVGAVTALFAATMGLFQYDIKKVLAYSTVSQLGYMFIGVGVGAWWAGIFHLLTHAAFKACLFLGSGSVIHGMHFLAHHGHGNDGDDHQQRDLRLRADPADPQDMRNMGGLAKLMPRTRLTYLIACISIAGFPIAAGFYSKDEILWKAMANGSTLVPGPLLWFVGFLAAGCTSFYMFRSYYFTFFHREATAEMKHHVHESPACMTYVLWALAGLAVVTGPILGFPMLWTGSEPLFEQWLHPVTSLGPFRQHIESHGLEWALMLASVGIATLGWLTARFFYRDAAATERKLADLKSRFAGTHRLLYNKYWVDEIYQATVVRGFMALSRCLATIDKKIVDGLVNATSPLIRGASWLSGWIDRTFVDGAVNGVGAVVIALGRHGRRLQTGRINNYAYGVVVGVIVLFLFPSLMK